MQELPAGSSMKAVPIILSVIPPRPTPRDRPTPVRQHDGIEQGEHHWERRRRRLVGRHQSVGVDRGVPPSPREGDLIIPMIIRAIRRAPSVPASIDEAPNLSRTDPSGADQSNAEHQPTDLKVGGSYPSRRTKPPTQRRYGKGSTELSTGSGRPWQAATGALLAGPNPCQHPSTLQPAAGCRAASRGWSRTPPAGAACPTTTPWRQTTAGRCCCW